MRKNTKSGKRERKKRARTHTHAYTKCVHIYIVEQQQRRRQRRRQLWTISAKICTYSESALEIIAFCWRCLQSALSEAFLPFLHTQFIHVAGAVFFCLIAIYLMKLVMMLLLWLFSYFVSFACFGASVLSFCDNIIVLSSIDSHHTSFANLECVDTQLYTKYMLRVCVRVFVHILYLPSFHREIHKNSNSSMTESTVTV